MTFMVLVLPFVGLFSWSEVFSILLVVSGAACAMARNAFGLVVLPKLVYNLLASSACISYPIFMLVFTLL